MKDKILIVGDYTRDDFLYIAKVMHNYYNIYFLEYTYPGEIKSDKHKQWGNTIFWSQYRSAIDLIDDVRPEMVLFYFIESFNHVALNVACKYKGVRTYHIEHGIRSYEMLAANIGNIATNQGKFDVKAILNKFSNIRSRLKGRLFFKNTIVALPQTYGLFLQDYFAVRSTNSVFETFSKINNPLRIADSYISFSPKIFEFHQKSDHLPKDYPVHFIGCPSFDTMAGKDITHASFSNLLFIDNAFESQGLFGWTEENKNAFLKILADFSERHHCMLWFKPHPYSKKSIFDTINKRNNVVLIENNESFNSAIENCGVVIGFYSTLLMPFMAMDHTVCFSLEMHPGRNETWLSKFLTDTGAIQGIDDWQQLSEAFLSINQIHTRQRNMKTKFIEDWLYKFDGKATERLKELLLTTAGQSDYSCSSSPA